MYCIAGFKEEKNEQGYTKWKIYSKLADHQQHFLNQKGEVNFFIRKFWKSFSDFISVIKRFIKILKSIIKIFEKLMVNLSEIFLGGMMQCLKSSLVCRFKDMGWTRFSSIGMGEGCCYW